MINGAASPSGAIFLCAVFVAPVRRAVAATQLATRGDHIRCLPKAGTQRSAVRDGHATTQQDVPARQSPEPKSGASVPVMLAEQRPDISRDPSLVGGFWLKPFRLRKHPGRSGEW